MTHMTTPFSFSQDELVEMNQEALVAIFLKLQKYAEDQEAEIQSLRVQAGVHQEAHQTIMDDMVAGGKTTITNSKNVAAGPGARVTVSEVLQPDQRDAVRAALEEMRAELAALEAASDALRLEAEQRIAVLEQAFTAEDQEVDAGTGTRVKGAFEWLIRNLPGLAESVRALVESPAVRTLIEAAGENVSVWLRYWFPTLIG